jgi:hypothetical protein
MKSDDFVIATKTMEGVVVNSVGVVKSISDSNISVLFIGLQKTIDCNNGDVALLDIVATGKGHDKKICNICAILKNESDFDINQTDAKGQKTTRPSCKTCRIVIDGKPLSAGEKKRMSAIKPKGLFKCPICEKTGIVGITVSIVQDHCHERGKGRDWICDSCNTGLGRFKDSQVLLQKAIEYLKKHE